MYYIESQAPRYGDGLCSDDECPCSNTSIKRGEGYIYVSPQCCDFRKDCLTMAQAESKLEAMSRRSGTMMMFTSGIIAPVLVCERGARKRGLDMAIAAADAKYWWETGKAPLRPTPMAGQPERPMTPVNASYGGGGGADSGGGCLVFLAILPLAGAVSAAWMWIT